MQKIIFSIFVFLLPVCALGYNKKYLSTFSMNASIYPFLIGIILVFFSIMIKKDININKDVKKIYKSINIFLVYIIIDTLIMGFILSFFIDDHNGRNIQIMSMKNWHPLILIYLILFYVIYNIKNFKNLKGVLKIIYISMFIICIYGYIQLFAYYFQGSIFNKIYIFISNRIDFAWQKDESWNYVLVNGGRLNLTTPESSEAAHLINVLIFPIILAIFMLKRKIENKKIKKLLIFLFILYIPIITFMFSSTTYIICGIQIIFAFLIYAKNNIFNTHNNILNKIKPIFILLIVFVILVSFKNIIPYETIQKYLLKLSDLNNGSTNTRMATMLGGIKTFLHYPLNGVGWGNGGFFIYKYLPYWSGNNYELNSYLGDSSSWFSCPMNVYMVVSGGIVGGFLYWYIYYKIFIKLKELKDININYEYLYDSFVIYLIGVILQGFNCGIFEFIYPWVMLAIYIAGINIINENNKIKN